MHNVSGIAFNTLLVG